MQLNEVAHEAMDCWCDRHSLFYHSKTKIWNALNKAQQIATFFTVLRFVQNDTFIVLNFVRSLYI